MVNMIKNTALAFKSGMVYCTGSHTLLRHRVMHGDLAAAVLLCIALCCSVLDDLLITLTLQQDFR